MSGIRHARIDCEGNRPCGEWNCDYCHPLPTQPVAEAQEETAQGEKCGACDGKGTEADYVGLEMRCVETECSRCKGSGSEPSQQENAPQQPIPCPTCSDPIFVRENDTIVSHYNGDGLRCAANETKMPCDCWKHECQVCDICQGVTGPDAKPVENAPQPQQEKVRNRSLARAAGYGSGEELYFAAKVVSDMFTTGHNPTETQLNRLAGCLQGFEYHWHPSQEKPPAPSQPQPAESDGFEEWWIANGPCEGNSSFRKIEWALTVMRNMCGKAWQAKLESLLAQKPEAKVSDVHLSLVIFTSGLHGSNFAGLGTPDDEAGMADELQRYRRLFKDAEKGMR